MRAFQFYRWVCMGCELTVNTSLKRVGAGAFGYDFGALDDADNALTKSYMDIMYDRLPLIPATQGSCRTNNPLRSLGLRPSATVLDY